MLPNAHRGRDRVIQQPDNGRISAALLSHLRSEHLLRQLRAEYLVGEDHCDPHFPLV
jgi:hypothetical protein